MAEQKRNQPNQQNRGQQQGSPGSQGSQRRDKNTSTQQTQGNRPDESWREDDQQSTDPSERDRSHREPSSIADDRGMGADRERRNFSEDRESIRLGSEVDDETAIDDEDVDERDRSDR